MDYTALTEVFGDKLTYIIPPYQRPYSWDCIGKSEKNNQINVMWDDIYNFYNENHKGFYFMGSMVLIPDRENERIFEVIDGQQRLTSMMLLLVSIKCFLSKMIGENPKITLESNELIKFVNKAISVIETIVYNEELVGTISLEKKVKIAKNAEFDYDVVLKNVLEGKEEPKPNEINHFKEEHRRIVLRYYKNRKYLEDQIEKKFFNGNLFTTNDFRELNKFIDFLKTKVSFVIIRAKDFEFAYRIFETLNNRGLPLSNKDLFRNFIIEKFSELALVKINLDPSKKWNDLDSNFELKEDFIGRWVESKKSGQQKLSAFNDLKEDIYVNYYKDSIDKYKIESLYDDIKQDLGYYTLIIKQDSIVNIEISNRIAFLHNCGNNRYTLNLLLSLFRQIQYDGVYNSELNDFLIVYEKFILFTLLNPAKRFSNAPIYQSIKLLNSGKLIEARKTFEVLTNEIELEAFLDTEIKDNDLAKLIISKYVWCLQTKASNDVITQKLHYDNATLEHVIPQNPDNNTNWLSDFSTDFKKKFTYKLGNMTLLTQALNSGAKNYDFSKKKEKYANTNLAFTKELTMLNNITEDFIKQRQIDILNCLKDNLKINS